MPDSRSGEENVQDEVGTSWLTCFLLQQTLLGATSKDRGAKLEVPPLIKDETILSTTKL